jgi:hypothetical protein
MAGSLTLEEAEQIRKRLNMDVYQFSLSLGLSTTTYHMALKRKKLSMWIMREIPLRYGRLLAEVRQCAV